ncbi:hypothetical protein CLU96_1896 [Chryseobacterium sp. 52]|uniref:hypothetical protein n=1 Tax=Chryseobacterium sp. 52 TaxID=2035213 RepID=UPI000C1A566F|nr:hypothetical protein [Chryseobacterium sp. 52]PIF44899.1 hypothetical protein CLU96_1896 [Chryseobacterium sp. 52]
MATLKKLMTLLSKEGLLDQRADVINLYTGGRTSSAKELTPFEIQALCDTITENSQHTLDKKRKRVLASIFGLYKKMNKKVSIEYVKGHACRAAKVDDFNKIPASRLDSIYNAFLKAQKDLEYSGRLVEIHNFEQTTYN